MDKNEIELRKEIELHKANSQFIGFGLASRGYDIIELVSGMGLKEDEWTIIKKDYSHDLDDFQIRRIDNYFKTK